MLKYRIISAIYALLIIITLNISTNFTEQITIILGTTVIYLIILTWGAANIRSQLFVKAINSNPNVKDKVAITYDDGPHANTPKILEILKNYNAKASFFLIGTNIAEDADIANKIHSDGHLIGNHSFSHSNLFPIRFPSQIKNEISLNQEAIKTITQTDAKYFRPPFGVTNPLIAYALQGLNIKTIGWNIRTMDTTSKSKKAIINNVTSKIKGGDIILLHDKSEHVLWLTEEILKHLKSQNIQAVTVEELLS